MQTWFASKDLPKVRPDTAFTLHLLTARVKKYDAQIYSIGTAFTGLSKTIPVHTVILGDKTGLVGGMNATPIVNIPERMNKLFKLRKHNW